jgi:uncharacterized ferredoxin-like protein
LKIGEKMPILRNSEIDSLAVNVVAELMAASARTAPKGGGVDNTSTAVLTGNEKDELADAMERRGLRQVYSQEMQKESENHRQYYL